MTLASLVAGYNHALLIAKFLHGWPFIEFVEANKTCPTVIASFDLENLFVP